MAKGHVAYAAVVGLVAILAGPLVASVVRYVAVQIFVRPVAPVEFPAFLLAVALPATLVLGPLVHVVLQARNWVRWFHYAAASAMIAIGFTAASNALINEWSIVLFLLLVPLGIIAGIVGWLVLQIAGAGGRRHARSWTAALGALVLINAGLIVPNWRQLELFVAVLATERLPALLDDARWNDSASARKFSARFHNGSDERELLAWLKDNGFVIEPLNGRAGRSLGGFPCARYVEITWTASRQQIVSAETRVSGTCI